MKKTVFLTLLLISIVLIVAKFASLPINQFLGSRERAGIKVLSVPDQADVYINGQMVGKTPYQSSDLEAQEYSIKVANHDLSWQGKVDLNGGTLAVVNRELNKESSSSAGEILTLEKGTGVFVNSLPDKSTVEIDGVAQGETPLVIPVTPGDHDFVLSHQGFLKRSIKATIPDNFRLDLNVDLSVADLDSSITAAPTITESPKVVVKDTPTGFLRVRDKPSVSGSEVEQVKPGDELVLLEEGPSWDKVQLSDGKEGYVSVTYLQKKAVQ